MCQINSFDDVEINHLENYAHLTLKNIFEMFVSAEMI